MSTDIEFDRVKAARNLLKHGVSFAHAEQALWDVNAVTIEDDDADGEPRWVTVGMDALGRVLVIVHTQRGNRTRLISARKASQRETQDYARRI
jgi:uncharacterized DUF497 family protein